MLHVNDKAPDFTLVNQKGEKRTLSEYIGQTVVLYFYPKDDTPGCTIQACSYRDNMAEFEKRGIKVFGISKDDVKSHQKFESKYQLNFEILADDGHQALNAYGVWKEKNMYGKKVMGVARTTFIVNKEGIITHIFEKVDPNTDTQLVLDAIQ